MIAMETVTVVIPNYNGKKYLDDCFRSLKKQTYSEFRVIIVDNGSTDGSAEYIKSKYPDVEVIALNENTGFAKGDTGNLYNVAMMSDCRDVLSFGAGGMSKRCFAQEGELYKHRVERCPTIKDALTYIERVDEMAEKKIAFFEMQV